MALRPFIQTHGISHLTSPPHTPKHNGAFERCHCHIVDIGVALLHKASMPLHLWPYAISTATYLINRLSKVNLQMLSSYEKLFNHPPNLSKLRVFGCQCYPWLRPYYTHKLNVLSTPCVFIGYSPTQSAYLCLDRSSNKVYVSRHVEFVETIFPFATPLPPTPTTITPIDDSIVMPTPPPISFLDAATLPAPQSTPASPLPAPSPLVLSPPAPPAPPSHH